MNLFALAGWLKARFGSSAGQIDDVRMDAATSSLQVVQYEHHEIHANSHYFIQDFLDTGFDSGDDIDFVLTTDDSDKWVHLLFNFMSNAESQLDIYEGATVTANTGDLVVQRGNNRAQCHSGSHTGASGQATVMTDSNASFTVDALIGWKIYNITDGSYGIITDNDATTVTVAALVGGTDNDWDLNDDYEINQSLAIVRSEQTITDLGIRIGGENAGDATSPNRGVPGAGGRENEFVLRPNTSYVFRFASSVNGNVLTYNAEWYEHTDHN